MQQAGVLQQRDQGGQPEPQIVRLLHHRRAAVWFMMLTVAGLAQIGDFIVVAIILATGKLRSMRHEPESLGWN